MRISKLWRRRRRRRKKWQMTLLKLPAVAKFVAMEGVKKAVGGGVVMETVWNSAELLSSLAGKGKRSRKWKTKIATAAELAHAGESLKAIALGMAWLTAVFLAAVVVWKALTLAWAAVAWAAKTAWGAAVAAVAWQASAVEEATSWLASAVEEAPSWLAWAFEAWGLEVAVAAVLMVLAALAWRRWRRENKGEAEGGTVTSEAVPSREHSHW